MADRTEEEDSSKSPRVMSQVLELRADATQFARLTGTGDRGKGLREKPQSLDFVTRDLYQGTLGPDKTDRKAAVRKMNYPAQDGPISWKPVISERYRRNANLPWPKWCSLTKEVVSSDGGGGTGI